MKMTIEPERRPAVLRTPAFSTVRARQNNKQWLSFVHELHGIPLDELEDVAAKYRPMLEGLGVLDGLYAYQEVMLFVWLWKHDKEIEDAATGVADVRVKWDD